jgi:hypothetical protein
MKVPEPKRGKNRLHIDRATSDELETEVKRIVGLGGALVEWRSDPDTMDNPDRWAVMLDPEGNEFCVTVQTLPGWA